MEQFEAGQVWAYETRPNERESRVIVCRVDSDPKLGEIVHVRITGLRMKNKHAAEGFSEEIGHMPFSGKALRSSVTTLKSSETRLPEFNKGYSTWKSAFDDGKAGIWTLPISEAINGMETVVNQ